MIPVQKVNIFYTALWKTFNPSLYETYLHNQPNVKPYYEVPHNEKKEEEQHHGRHSDKGKDNKKNKKNKKNNDDDNGGGGMLEPLIQDIKGWIKKKRPVPSE